MRVTLLHACDMHGSEIVWNKYLRSCEYYNADISLMCGDLTGKAISPIIKRPDGTWKHTVYGNEKIIKTQSEYETTVKLMRDRGYYVFDTTEKELDDYKGNIEKQKELFLRLMLETLDRWLYMVRKITTEKAKLVIMPGNDDHFEIDKVIKRHAEEDKRVIFPLDRVVEIGDKYKMISCPYVNDTPWQTPRECSDEELKKKLEGEFSRVKNNGTVDNKFLITNFHCPPYDTYLDVGPALDRSVYPPKPITRFGQPLTAHVGSKSVKTLLEEYQPLLSLHGHIHESAGFVRIGKRPTLCLNPGSDYIRGIMRAFFIILEDEKVDFQRVEV
jgi:Icc-related predicted phosphoesterase